MKRNEEQIAGQLWIQGDRQMTASNKVLDGMANTRESAVLSAVVDAVAWRHAGEPEGPRKGQRVIVDPKDISQLPAVLSMRDPSIDNVDGHPIAYQAILQHSDGYENPLVFLSEDSEPVVSDPARSIRVPEWMAAAGQVATGNRQRVLEEGDDKMDSSDEDDPKMHPGVLTGMYTAEMDPKQGPHKLSQSEAARQRAMAQARKEQMITSVPIVESPDPDFTFDSVEPPSVLKSGGSSDDDTLERPEYIWSVSQGNTRKNKAWVRRLADSALALPAPEPEPATAPRNEDKPATGSRDVTGSSTPTVGIPKGTKAAASPRAPAARSKGTKVPPPTKEQQAPKHPMATRTREASGAGGLRGVVGSGSTGYVCDKLSPSSKPGS
jgi:hypothetical protein